jgi:hypothetical protein
VTLDRAALTPEIVQVFIDTYDRTDPTDRWIAKRLTERLHGEMYRREREVYPQWIDQGGES